MLWAPLRMHVRPAHTAVAILPYEEAHLLGAPPAKDACKETKALALRLRLLNCRRRSLLVGARRRHAQRIALGRGVRGRIKGQGAAATVLGGVCRVGVARGDAG